MEHVCACRRAGAVVAVLGSMCLLNSVTTYAQSAPSARAAREGTPATIVGVVTALYADDFRNQRSELIHYIRDERTQRSFRLRFRGDALNGLKSGIRAQISGRVLDEELLVEAASIEPAGGTGTPTGGSGIVSDHVTGDQRTLVMLANFRDVAVTCSPDDVRAMVFGDAGSFTVSGLYLAASESTVTFSGAVANPVTIDAASTDPCDISGWSAAADAQLLANGVTPSAYPRRVYVMPPNSCPAAGYGTVGGAQSNAWVFTCDVAGVFAHEIGHNLGMGHASSPTSRYGDGTDPMGFSGWQLRGLNAAHRQQLGWLDTGSVALIQEGGVHTLPALALDAAQAPAPRALMVPKPDTNEYYYVAFRQPLNFDR